MTTNKVFRTIKSRYGVERRITSHGGGWYTMEGQTEYMRAGTSTDGKELSFLDPEGGPFLMLGDHFEDLGTIVSLLQEASGKKDYFKLRFEVSQDEPSR